jgi:hypothetical protein
MSKLTELKDTFRAAQKRMQQEGKGALKEAIEEVFEKHPQLMGIRWEQFTPYFNDGEACEFSVHEPTIKMKGGDASEPDEDAEEDDDGYDYYSSYSEEKYSPEKRAAYKDVSAIFEALPDELLLAVFDDHARITVTRRGFSVDECSHD